MKLPPPTPLPPRWKKLCTAQALLKLVLQARPFAFHSTNRFQYTESDQHCMWDGKGMACKTTLKCRWRTELGNEKQLKCRKHVLETTSSVTTSSVTTHAYDASHCAMGMRLVLDCPLFPQTWTTERLHSWYCTKLDQLKIN